MWRQGNTNGIMQMRIKDADHRDGLHERADLQENPHQRSSLRAQKW